MAFPTVVVEFGFNINPASPYLYLDDLTRGKLGTGLLAPDAGIWTTVTSSKILDLTVDLAGKQRLFDEYATTSCKLTIEDTDGSFDPNNLSGPYVSGGATLLRPMTPVRVSYVYGGTTYVRFQGFVDSWTPNWNGNVPVCVVQAFDGSKNLAAYKPSGPSAPVGGSELTGARINRLADLAGWSASDRDIDAGNSTLQTTTMTQNVWTEMQAAVKAEQGSLYFWGGKLTFDQRHTIMEATRSIAAQATFSDDPSVVGYPYSTPAPKYDMQVFRDEVNAGITGGTVQSVQDATAIAQYLARVESATGLVLETDLDAANWAAWELYLLKVPENRIEEITITPRSDDALWPIVLGARFHDRWRVVKKRWAASVPSVDVQVFLEGMTDTIHPGKDWSTKCKLVSASRVQGMFVLDSATLSVLGTNVLAGW